MAEAFVLDGTGDGPPAAAPDPLAEFEVAWQLPHRPESLPAEEPWWIARTGDNGILTIRVTRYAVARPAIGAAVRGLPEEIQLLQVRGHPAVRTSRFLIWDESPGVQVQLSFPGEEDLATLLRIAESLTPVPPDDPRIKNP